jgi:DNA-binding MarR family transcriptional regulator
MRKGANPIGELFLNVIAEFYEVDRKARTFGTDTELYHSEIHMLQCIAENPELHISGIARNLGITRGATSQTAKRLERKQMIVKKPDEKNRLRVVMRLSDKGKTACSNHRRAHERYNHKITTVLTGARAPELHFLKSFLERFQEGLKTK